MLFAVLLLLFLLAVIALAKARIIFAWFLERRRFNKLGNELFGQPGVPLFGNVFDLPRDSYVYSEYLINCGNNAVKAGENLYRWWVGCKLGVMTCDGEAARAILESPTEIKKGWDYEFYKQWLGDGLLLSHDESWRVQRRMLTPIFHFQMLDGYLRVFNRQARVLVALIREKVLELEGKNEPNDLVNLFPYIVNSSLDIIGEAVMGLQIGAQQNREQAYRHAVTRFNEFGYLVAISPHYWFQWIWYLFGYGRETDQIVHCLKALSNRVFFCISLLLEMHAEGQITLEQVREQVDTFIFAGHDTTAHALCWTLWCLATHPDAQQRVFTEVEDFLCLVGGTEVLLVDHEGEEEDFIISGDQLNQLRYLDACIKEAMRIFPPVPVIERKLRNDIQIGKHLVPRGADIVIAPLVIHHNERVWGPDHDQFNPDRFFLASEQQQNNNKQQQHNVFDYIPFSAGHRNCIGQRFAYLEMRTILVYIVHHFELSTPYGFHENARGLETILRPKLGVPVHIKLRQNGQNKKTK